MEDVPSTWRDQGKTRRDATHILENLLDWDPEEEDDSKCFQLFQELASIDGIDGIITLSHDNLQSLYDNLKKKINSISFCSILSINKVQFFLKNLQEKVKYEIGANFDYSSIDENNFIGFMNHHFWDF